MTNETYRAAREWTMYCRWSGYLCLAASLGLLGSIPLLRDRIPVAVWLLASAAFAALAALSRLIWNQLRGEYVEMSETGIRRRRSPLVSWGRVASLRERPWLRRIELIDHSGTVLVWVPYELESISNVVAKLIEHVGVPPAQVPLRQSRPSVLLFSSVLLALLGIALWAVQGDGAALFLTLLAVLGPLAEWAEGPPTTVSITEEFVEVRRWRRVARYRLAVITEVGFDRRTLDVVISLGEGVRVELRPRGVDPFGMFVTLEAAVWRAAA